jgi:hypothetical protein
MSIHACTYMHIHAHTCIYMHIPADTNFDSDFALNLRALSPSHSHLPSRTLRLVTAPSHIRHTRRLGSVTVLARCLGTQTSQCHGLGTLSKGEVELLTITAVLILSLLSSSDLGRLCTRTMRIIIYIYIYIYNVLSQKFILYLSIHQGDSDDRDVSVRARMHMPITPYPNSLEHLSL